MLLQMERDLDKFFIHFRGKLELRDRQGVPVYLLECFRCTVALNQMEDGIVFAAALKPLLGNTGALLEIIIARNAVRTGDIVLARAAWQAALLRAPDLAEANDWLKRHPMSPDGPVGPIGSTVLPSCSGFAFHI